MTDEQILAKQEDLYADDTYREMIDAGVFYGRKKSKTHPRMKQFILGNRNGLEIVNVVKTREMLDAALAAIKEKARTGGAILFVGTQPGAEGLAEMAAEFNYPAVAKRWLGGTLTNHRIIHGRIEYYKKLKSDIARDALDQYTKRERVGMEKEMQKLQEVFSGLENFGAVPALMVVLDSNLHMTAVREARHLRIPVVAFVNTDSDPDILDYPVLGNNKSKTVIAWFLAKVGGAIREGIAARPVKEPVAAKEAVQNVKREAPKSFASGQA